MSAPPTEILDLFPGRGAGLDGVGVIKGIITEGEGTVRT